MDGDFRFSHPLLFVCYFCCIYLGKERKLLFFYIMSGLQSSVLSPERSLVVYTFEILPSALLEGGRK